MTISLAILGLYLVIALMLILTSRSGKTAGLAKFSIFKIFETRIFLTALFWPIIVLGYFGFFLLKLLGSGDEL